MSADAQRVATARRWFRTLGHTPILTDGATILATPAHPGVWDANSAVAERGANPAAVLAALERHIAHSPWRVVISDALTDPELEATLALAGFTANAVTIEMLATGPVRSHRPRPSITTRAVADPDSIAAFDALAAADHAEGRRTGRVDAVVAVGLLAVMHGRMPPCDYALIVLDGMPVGYGMTVACPNGLGLIEHLFVLPAWRGRGVMSAFIVAAAERLRAAGCDGIFLDAHAADTPKRLYATLGFAPVAVTRNWVRRVDS